MKQYAENDVVTDNGQMYNVKLEDVPVNAAGNERVLRPLIRLPEKNIVLTRINPEVRTLLLLYIVNLIAFMNCCVLMLPMGHV